MKLAFIQFIVLGILEMFLLVMAITFYVGTEDRIPRNEFAAGVCFILVIMVYYFLGIKGFVQDGYVEDSPNPILPTLPSPPSSSLLIGKKAKTAPPPPKWLPLAIILSIPIGVILFAFWFATLYQVLYLVSSLNPGFNLGFLGGLVLVLIGIVVVFPLMAWTLIRRLKSAIDNN